MNILSNDDLFLVVQFLPPRDIIKFLRLNKQFGTVIESNSKWLPKPFLNLAVNRLPDNGTVTELVISKPSGHNLASIRGLMNTSAFIVFDKKTVHSFKSIVNSHFNETFEVELFLTWLLSKANIENLQLRAFPDLWPQLKQNIINTRCGCNSITLMNDLGLIPISDKDFISDLLSFQLHLEEYLQLRIIPQNRPNFFSFLERYTGLEFVANYNADGLIYAINTIILKWTSGSITKHTPIRVRFENFEYNQKTPPTRCHKTFLQNIKNLNLTVLNISEGTLDLFARYPTWHKELQHLDFKYRSEDDILRIGFVKERRTLLLTTEVVVPEKIVM